MKKYSKIVCLLVITFFVSCTNNIEYKQTTEVYGCVKDNRTGKPLENVLVELKFTGCAPYKSYLKDTTDELGNYRFDNIPGNLEHRRLWLIVEDTNYYRFKNMLDLLTEPVSYRIISLTKI